MPEYVPFRGVRYNRDMVGDMTGVVAPPYDILSEADVRELYERSIYNVVRLDLGTGEDGGADGPGCADWYPRSGELFRAWQRDDVLIRDEAPSFYVLRQRYRLSTGEEKDLVGVIGACRLEPFDQGIVLPHEHTFAKPKEDRLRLMRATEANLSPIYAFYSDPELKVDRLLAEVIGHDPDLAVRDNESQRHDVWVVNDAAVQDSLSHAMAEVPVYIADGHHRYETALAYRDEQIHSRGEGLGGSWEYVMMFVVNLDAGGITILPTHRLLRGVPLPKSDRLQGALNRWYRVEEIRLEYQAGLERAREDVTEESGHIACYLGESTWMWLYPKDERDVQMALPDDRSDAVKSLTVTALHEIVLPRGFGVDRAMQEGGEHIEYLRDAEAGLERVDRREAMALFYVPAPTPSRVCEVARAGDVMPHKSTYFYPKLLTGLVINDLALPVGAGT